MKLATVVVDIQTQALDTPYTYLLSEQGESAMPESLFSPADLGEEDPVLARLSAQGFQPQVGCTVLVPLGGRKAVGFIVGIACVCPEDPSWPEGLDPAKLRAVEAVLSQPFFDEEGAACALWLAKRYIAPLSSCVRLFTPPGGVPRIVRGKQGWRLEEAAVGEVDCRWVVAGPGAASFVPRKNAVKQQQVLDAVRNGDVRMAELAAEFGSVASTVKTLQEKGVVRVESRRRMRGVNAVGAASGPLGVAGGAGGADAPGGAGGARGTCDAGAAGFVPSEKPALTEGQEAALSAIRRAVSANAGNVVLVDGVTGSGKTEVYLQAIEEVLASGRNAVVLVPEISLTPQTVARFRGRFGDMVAVMHSRMSQGERFDQWDFIRSGAARVVVGARSALFTPMANVGLIVIDEEHEGSYKQDSAPRYRARDVAIWQARRSGAAVVLGSATPSVGSLHEAEENSAWCRVGLPERANGRPLPPVRVVDMAAEFGQGRRSMFSRPLTQALRETLEAGRKAVLLLNQRGFAKFLLCRDCGFVPECPSCSTSLTYHERGNFITCHHCGYQVAAPAVCPSCGSPYLKKFGAGTQRVEDELLALIADFPSPANGALVVRMDADTTSKKGAHQRLLDKFGSAGAAVLLGTQMIAKGLDFKDVTLVGVINADTQLHLPDYRAAERTFSLVQQVAGRAGRDQLQGQVIVQTYEAKSVPILAAATYDRARFLEDELPKRRALEYPPYVGMANVLVWGHSEPAVREAAQRLAAQLHQLSADYTVGWTVLPAVPCVLAKLRNTYRWHIVVKYPCETDASSVLEPFFRARKAEQGVNVAVDIDPDNLL